MHALPFAALALAACGSSEGRTVGWRGPTPHVSIHGGLDGVPVELELGISDSVFQASATCTPPIAVTIRIPDGDVDKRFELGVAPLSWSWEDPVEGDLGFEGPARAGEVELALTPEEGDGLIGLRFAARWPSGALIGSMTVPCADEPAPSPDHRSRLAAEDSRDRDRGVNRGD